MDDKQKSSVKANHGFNPLERAIARFLAATPRLKLLLKKLYQFVNWLIYRQPYTSKSSKTVTKVESSKSSKNTESFFGYYDKSPENATGEYVLFHESVAPTSEAPTSSAAADVVVCKADTFEEVGRFASRAYNWQQGTKAQWISDYRFIFNDFDTTSNTYVAKIIDARQPADVTVIQSPIYDCFGDAFAISIDFTRLARLSPDYGYFNISMSDSDIADLKHDGIVKVALGEATAASTEAHSFITLHDVVQHESSDSMQDAEHSVNHIMISPDGQSFMFIHRWYNNGRRYDRLLMSPTTAPALRTIVGEGMVSHCYWKGSNEIFGYFRGQDGTDAYFTLTITENSIQERKHPDISIFGDGHPSLSGELAVFDTYPNKARMKRLFSYDFQSENLLELGSFYESFKFYGESRCDLHPRLNYSASRVYFDSVHEGKRGLYRIDL